MIPHVIKVKGDPRSLNTTNKIFEHMRYSQSYPMAWENDTENNWVWVELHATINPSSWERVIERAASFNIKVIKTNRGLKNTKEAEG